MKTTIFFGALCVMVLCASMLPPVMGSDSDFIGTKSMAEGKDLIPQEARWGGRGYGGGWGRGRGYGGGWGRGGYGGGWGRGGYGGGWGHRGYGRGGYGRGWGRR